MQNKKQIVIRTTFNSQALIIYVLLSCLFIFNAPLSAQSPVHTQFKSVDLNLRNKVAQMIMIDMRYFCEPAAEGFCLEPVLTLPKDIEQMLVKARVGGVLLYSENLDSTAQIVTLNHQLQTAALTPFGDSVQFTDSVINPPSLYIGIDQEGGRVTRLPLTEFVPFLGNMALGATYTEYKTDLAKQVASQTAITLINLGFNVNFAPVLDVNNNAQNPVINVRSFSQSPALVSQLGQASISAMQNQGLATAAKHFPGHGDTFIDSHVGLPRVEHSKQTITDVDLLPFKEAIANVNPDMIMTAHIQYPELDSTPFTSEEEVVKTQEDLRIMESAVLPATLSQEILTGVLRNEMGYKGLIITDALDMAAISTFLSPTEAVIKSFDAGANITLMPFSIASAEDAVDFLDWLNGLTVLISQSESLTEKVEASFQKIIAHKRQRKTLAYAQLPLEEKLKRAAKKEIEQDKRLARIVSKASFTSLKSPDTPLSPSSDLLVFMPDKRRCDAFNQAWQNQHEVQQTANKIPEAKGSKIKDQKPLDKSQIAKKQTLKRQASTISESDKPAKSRQVESAKELIKVAEPLVAPGSVLCFSLLSESIPLSDKRLEGIDAIIVGDVFPAPNFYEVRDYEGISPNQRKDWDKQYQELEALLQEASDKNVKRILVKLRSPYINEFEAKTYHAIYASYDYQVAEFTKQDANGSDTYLFAPSMDTFVRVMTGKWIPTGTLPVKQAKEVLPYLSLSK